ncbi:sulfide:quinone oxidoreductase, mitochondrial-like [Ptychodera flava]|uniref:sulfide:quinone oxidoreductase, mitochondrial-like n=1 Tax=Ptychodera flava TaxID=63121 RepID=UPI00396A466F
MALSNSLRQGRRLLCQHRGAVAVAITHHDFSTSSQQQDKHSFKCLIVGGGAGGIAMAAKLARKLGKGQVGLIEPHENHVYQPMWTLVGGGLKKMEQSIRPQSDVMPKNCQWIADTAEKFDPDNNTVVTGKGHEVKYEYLILATGIQLNYHLIKGLPEGFKADPQLCSNYSMFTAPKTFPAIQNFQGGNAIFTFPNTPIKCAGAPQKIMYLAEDYFRKNGKRDSANVIFNTSLGVIFGVKKYADRLTDVYKSRGITVNFKHNLIEVRPEKREAVFEVLESDPKETVTFNYDMLHVTPPMSGVDSVRNSALADENGYVDTVKETLQHKKYPNVFGIGDCTNVPTSKTAAAVAGQCGVLLRTISAVMKGKTPKPRYDGYTSCPLITGYGKAILAEFDFDGQPLETFPFDQGREMRTMYHLKKDIMPEIYWQMLLKGLWNGPRVYRKMMHLGLSR